MTLDLPLVSVYYVLLFIEKELCLLAKIVFRMLKGNVEFFLSFAALALLCVSHELIHSIESTSGYL